MPVRATPCRSGADEAVAPGPEGGPGSVAQAQSAWDAPSGIDPGYDGARQGGTPLCPPATFGDGYHRMVTGAGRAPLHRDVHVAVLGKERLGPMLPPLARAGPITRS
ncbi:hypothetical protein [Streptomyces sp. NPDC057686]|uniref:hypothetical protein n=1 Tax=Streptomyces sp. NPDC057686 TaxID=3346212 RepID=UPI003690652B